MTVTMEQIDAVEEKGKKTGDKLLVKKAKLARALLRLKEKREGK